MNKKIDIFLFGILSIILGALVGAVTWLFLKGLNIVTEFIWISVPEFLGISDVSLIGQDKPRSPTGDQWPPLHDFK